MKKIFFLMLAFLIGSAASMNAQVTIGSDQDPHEAAVLDLSKTSNRGFLLPRVSLADAKLWGLEPASSTDAEGLMVYNENAGVLHGYGAGVYIWSGDMDGWVLLKPKTDCSSVTDAEGNTYLAAKFGVAGCWMTQNLRSTYTWHESTKQEIPKGDNSTNLNQPFYYYPNASATLSNPTYGALYTWAAANIGVSAEDTETNPVNRQGICPAGWHLPSDFEWNQLEQVIAESAANVYATTGAQGRKMKSTTPVDTYATNGTSCDAKDNGFDAKLVGFMNIGNPILYGEATFYWMAGAFDGYISFGRFIKWEHDDVSRLEIAKSILCSVRCKKNDN
jgi:uncharacterized protein (TIGR02145 family)